MADTDDISEINLSESPTSEVGSEQQVSNVLTQPPVSAECEYLRDSPTPRGEKSGGTNTKNNEQNTTSQMDDRFTAVPSDVWASFFRGVAEGFRSDAGVSCPQAGVRRVNPSDVCMPSFDCEFPAAQWFDEVDRRCTENSWTDYETRNVAFTHLRGRARGWASKSYPLCKTWVEAKERLSRQFAAIKRFHDLFQDMVKYTSDRTRTYVEYSTNKLAMIDRLESAWSEANKIKLLSQRVKYIDVNFTAIETQVAKILSQCEDYGLNIDKNLASQMLIDVKESQNMLQGKAYKLCGYTFNPNSSKDVAKVLGIYRGRKVSTKKSVLMTHDSIMAKIIIYWRKLNAILTKTLYPLNAKASIRNESNRIYPTYIMHTCTGRVSMNEPNLQSVPRTFSIPVAFLCIGDTCEDPSDDVVEYNCRNIFIASPGHLLVSADYCQIEMRILTHFCEDDTLMKIMKSDMDVFTSIAASWGRVSEDKVDDELRQRAKQLCYGIIYGMGTKTLSQQLDVCEMEAAVIMETFYSTYPSIKDYTQRVIDDCKKKGYVETLMKRRRHLPDIKSKIAAKRCAAERQAVNTIIQGSAADIVKHAMCDIAKKVEDNTQCKAHLVLQMHDELIYEVSETSFENFIEILKRSMENTILLCVPLPVKIKYGCAWGSMQNLN